MKTLFVCAVLTLFCGSLYSQGTTHVVSPINYIIDSGCGSGESVAVSGFVYSVVRLTRAAQDRFLMFEAHDNFRGDTKAVGMDSGQVFNVTGGTLTRVFFDGNSLESFTYLGTFKIVGLYNIKYTQHIIFGDDPGNPKVFVDQLRVVCK